jgi:hypothetical protein
MNDAIKAWAAKQNEQSRPRDRWRRILGGDDVDESLIDESPDAAATVIDMLLSLPRDEAARALAAIGDAIFKQGFVTGAASVRNGRPDKWTYARLLDFLCDLEEAPGASRNKKRDHVAEQHGIKDSRTVRELESRARRALKGK